MLRLHDRALIRISGEKGLSLLNSICTKSISANAAVVSTLFLNAKGRVLFDALVTPISSQDFLVEISKATLNLAISHIQRYNLRSKALIREENLQVYFSKSAGQNQDPRVAGFGYRSYTSENSTDTLDLSKYHRRRVVEFGIPEAPFDIVCEKSFPYECNADWHFQVDSQKGCYLGQELTNRTFINGAIRKRLIPYAAQSIDEIYSQSAGTVPVVSEYKALDGSFGFVSARLDSLQQNRTLCFPTSSYRSLIS